MSQIDTYTFAERTPMANVTPRESLLRPQEGSTKSRQSQTIGWLADWRLDGETHHEACAYSSTVKTIALRLTQSVLPHCGELLRNESLLITC